MRMLAVNDLNIPIGQYHPRAKLTDADVDIIRDLHASGMTYREIAEKMCISEVTVGRICRYERRAQTVSGFRWVD